MCVMSSEIYGTYQAENFDKASKMYSIVQLNLRTLIFLLLCELFIKYHNSILSKFYMFDTWRRAPLDSYKAISISETYQETYFHFFIIFNTFVLSQIE